MRILVLSAAVFAASALPSIGDASAQGLIDLHAKVRTGNKICLVDHFHDGSSAGQASKKAAEIVAIRVWQDFTTWEYGSAWGSYRLAASQNANCTQSGGGWSCVVRARPCRSAR